MGELRLPRINTIVLSGRLTRDVELRYTTGGTPVAKLAIAFDRNFQKDGEWHQETSYIDVVVWSKRGEQCAEALHKGSPVLLEGYLRTRTYLDKDNMNRKITEVVAQKVSFLEKKSYAPGEQSQPDTGTIKHEPVANVTDDDVPF